MQKFFIRLIMLNYFQTPFRKLHTKIWIDLNSTYSLKSHLVHVIWSRTYSQCLVPFFLLNLSIPVYFLLLQVWGNSETERWWYALMGIKIEYDALLSAT